MNQSRGIRLLAKGLFGMAGGLAVARMSGAVAAQFPPKPANAAVAVVLVCPGNEGSNVMSADQFNEMAATQDQLLASLGAVQTYIKPELGPSQGTRLAGVDSANPSSVFGTVGMGGPWDRRMVFVEATGTPADLQRHADALTLLVPRPDRVVVCPTALSEGARGSIAEELRVTYSGVSGGRNPSYYWASPLPNGKVGVYLRSDGAALANELTKKYGSSIEIWLGHLSWPDPSARQPTAIETCKPAVPTTLRELTWKLPKTISVRSGESFVISYQLRSSKVAVQVPHFRVVVTDLTGKQVVASSARDLAYTANIDSLQPKVWRTSKAAGGTDVCVPSSTSWKLSPGNYLAFIVPATTSASPVDWGAQPVGLTVTP
jgi:hypothetical protein